MADPIDTQLTKIDALQTSLAQYIATPNGPDFKNGKATPTVTLGSVSELFKITYTVSKDIESVGKGVSSSLNDAANAVRKIADKLDGLKNSASGEPLDAVATLQAALATAQALIPGGSPAMDSGSQFFGQIADLLKSVGSDVGQAQTILYKLAQEFDAIAKSLEPS